MEPQIVNLFYRKRHAQDCKPRRKGLIAKARRTEKSQRQRRGRFSHLTIWTDFSLDRLGAAPWLDKTCARQKKLSTVHDASKCLYKKLPPE